MTPFHNFSLKIFLLESLSSIGAAISSPPPPSFAQSRLDTLLVRRQQIRPSAGGGTKYTKRPTRLTNLSDDWEFAGTFSPLFFTYSMMLSLTTSRMGLNFSPWA